jgi:catechol 2,3-dioxygenase-like lactoylglutathione lyase family enzyme
MLPIRGLYEIAIPVRELTRAEAFYRDVLGFEASRRDETWKRVFLRVDGLAGMVVLQESDGTWPAQRFAFRVEPADLKPAAEALRRSGVMIAEPRFHRRTPAICLSFSDPDGHTLELCALMHEVSARSPEIVDGEFFYALLDANADDLDGLLRDDFTLIDVLAGSEIPKAALVGAIRDRQLVFERIDRSERRLRVYGATAVVTGRTAMTGHFSGEAFHANSRYTHVFVREGGRWRMVSAQGTPIAHAPSVG